MSEIKPGDFVKIIGQETIGEVLNIKGKDVEVAVGLMKFSVKRNKVEPARAPQTYDVESSNNYGVNAQGIDTKEKLMRFKFELDVRGKAKEEVMVELEEWADDAILLGISEAKILHGRGNGILKNTVRSVLRKYKEIDNIADEQEGGGNGVSIVKFKT